MKGELAKSVVNSVAEEIEAAVIETVKHWRELQIQTYWNTGEILKRSAQDNNIGISELVAACAKDNRLIKIRMGERSLWFSVQLYKKYPDFEQVYLTEYGQNVSVAKLKELISGKKEEADMPTDTDIANSFIKKYGLARAHKIAKIILAS